MIEKILTGKKTIESRWYGRKCDPWDNVHEGDTIYFKNASEPIAATSKVKKVIQFDDLTPSEVEQIIEEYYKDLGIGDDQITEYYEHFKNKKYCILIFLDSAKKIKPFRINKSGFGNMCAWLTVDDIEKIKIQPKPKIVQKSIFKKK